MSSRPKLNGAGECSHPDRKMLSTAFRKFGVESGAPPRPTPLTEREFFPVLTAGSERGSVRNPLPYLPEGPLITGETLALRRQE
jgi:hypothetical protein